MSIKKILLYIVVLVISCNILGCTKGQKAKKPLRISLDQCPGYAYAFIAQEKGFFKKNGVEVEFIFRREPAESAKLYLNGEVDGIFTLIPEVLMFNFQGLPTKLVCIVDYSQTGDVIVAQPNFNSLLELKGKVIGIEGINTFSNIFVLKVLENVGLQESQMRFKIIPAHQILAALESGEIDAGHTWEPTKSEALEKGYKILATAQDAPGIIIDVLAFNKKSVIERPEDIEKVLKSLFEARKFINSNNNEALAIMSKFALMSKDEMNIGLSGARFLDLKENAAIMQKSKSVSSVYSVAQSIADFYLLRGQLPKRINLDEIIEPRFIQGLLSTSEK